MAQAHDASASEKSFYSFFERTRKHNPVNGHATIIAQPAYSNLLEAEPVFRRLIPVFIITFLFVIGVARTVQLMENRDETLRQATEQLVLIATLVEHQIEQEARNILGANVDEQLAGALANATPAGATRDGRVLLVAGPKGRILAEEPASNGHKGTYLSDILEPTQALLTFGARAGVMQLPLVATGEPALVTLRYLDNGLGTITLYQPEEALLAKWRTDVSLNASIFIGTSVLLIVFLYAFFSQTSRADEADTIYQEIYSRFDTALKRGKCGLWDWDVGRGRAFWSPSMFEILGMPPRQSLMGFGEVRELVHPDDIDLMKTAENVLSEGLTQVDQIYRMLHADGHWVWVRARGETVPGSNGETPHLVGICIDITDQIKLEHDNKTVNTQLRESIESLSEAFVLWDADNRLVVSNRKYRILNDLPEEIMVPGAHYDDIVKATKSPFINLQPSDTIQNSFSGRTFETALPDGRWLQIDERRTNNGGNVTISTDITRIKRNEASLRNREQELQAIVAHLERSEMELRNLATMFDKQREIAQEANRAKAQFLNNISHEWRTPLNAIIGFSDVMRHGAFGPLGCDRYREYCDDISKSGTYMLSFINDVLDMSEIEAGQFELELERIDASDILAGVVEASANEAKSMGIALTCVMPESIPMFADRRALKQILFNILSNALKFNRHGGRVEVTCMAMRDIISVKISDTGIGIPEEIIGQLGTPFKQVQNQHTKNHTGSGLGLAISKSLIEMHGGSLTIQSTFGKGTDITFTLPNALRSVNAA